MRIRKAIGRPPFLRTAEWGMREGDVRFVNGNLLYVSKVEHQWWDFVPAIVSWEKVPGSAIMDMLPVASCPSADELNLVPGEVGVEDEDVERGLCGLRGPDGFGKELNGPRGCQGMQGFQGIKGIQGTSGDALRGPTGRQG
jgi:hypothetical protein